MIFSDKGKAMGAGSSAELAVDLLTIIEAVLENEGSKEIIDDMVRCTYETDSNILKEFAQLLINY